MPEITLEHIAHRYSSKQVLEGFTCSFGAGKTTCLLGPSGCGKTTVLRLIAGLEVPLKGSISIDDQIVSKNGKILVPPHQRKTGFIFQDLALWPHFTVFDQIAFGLREWKEKQVSEKVLGILELFGIKDQVKKYPHQLSGGQKQMVAIARSIVLQPEVLLMDEPLANIDVTLKATILRHLQSLREQYRFTMLYVTHDHREAMQTGDSISVMNAGKIEVSGTVQQMRESSNEFVKSFIHL
ncbi:MAG TPA: ABC transporter ATP-binding protein [Anseongella sp.]